jgi:Domain of unknown function (DUF4303)
MSNAKIQTTKEILREELKSAWVGLKARHSNEKFYAFGMYCNDVATWFNVAACTEEGLDSTASAYAQRECGSDKNLHATSLRWSIADSPLMAECEGLLPQSQAIREAEPDPYAEAEGSEKAIQEFFENAFLALAELDRAGIFGASNTREQLILSIWLNDESDESKVQAAHRLNSKLQVDRYGMELDAGYAAFKKIAKNENQGGA